MSKSEGHYIAMINRKCNSNCCFCADTIEDRSLPDRGYEELISELEENRESFDSIIISGGEPTIYPYLLKYVRHAKNIGYRHITLTTNGFMLYYEGFVKRLIAAGVDSFIISFLTTEPKDYWKITGVKNSHEYATGALYNLKNRGCDIRINIVIHRLNLEKIPDIVAFLAGLDVRSIQLSFMNPIGTSVHNGKSTMAVSYTEAMPQVRKAFMRARGLNYEGLFIENFPMCIARDFEDRISDLSKPDANKDYYNAEKAKPDKCRGCIYFDICDGTWKAYLEQFGDKELKPLRKATGETQGMKGLPSSLLGKPTGSVPHCFEWAGLDDGFKDASLFYIRKKDLPAFKKKIKSKAYHFEVSDFAFNHMKGLTKKTQTEIYPDSTFSVYVSPRKSICRRLKYLDKHHQFDSRRLSEKSGERVFLEIGRILGYPECCSHFIRDVNKLINPFNSHINTLSERTSYNETIYKAEALKRSSRVSHLLNNFSEQETNLIRFFVCNYYCKDAMRIARKVVRYMKRNDLPYKDMLFRLKLPILFFSSHKVISLEGTKRKGSKVNYSGVISRNNNFPEFGNGDAFSVGKNEIRVYKDDKLMSIIPRMHRYDGVFIEFE